MGAEDQVRALNRPSSPERCEPPESAAKVHHRASDNDTLCLIFLKKVAQLVRAAANLAADRCKRSHRERSGA
ncbi:MAG: hypothetical protein ACRDPY_37210, partial [Streptosporangiaceae bacterium]